MMHGATMKFIYRVVMDWHKLAGDIIQCYNAVNWNKRAGDRI
jgi:hypothetical protein